MYVLKENCFVLGNSEYKKTDACIDQFVDNCGAYDKFFYEMLEASWKYICEDKRQGQFC